MKLMQGLHFAAMAMLCLASPAQAQQEVESDKNAPSATVLERVEVRAKRPGVVEIRRLSSVAKQIYGREELDQFGDTDLAATVRRLPGLRVQDGEVGVRGFAAGYSQILIGGEPAPVGFNLSQLSPQQVERIEVLRAPVAEHGAQAVAGTLNIILRDPPLQWQRELKLGRTANGGHPALNASATVGGRKGALAFSVPLSVYQWAQPVRTFTSVQRRDAHGQETRFQTDASDVLRGHGLNMSPRLTWRLADDQTLTLQGFGVVNWFNGDEFGRTLVLEGSGPESVRDVLRQRGRFSTWRLGGQYERRLNEIAKLTLKLSSTQGGPTSHTSFEGEAADGQPSASRRTESSNTGRVQLASMQLSLAASESHALTAGLEVEEKRRRLVRDTQSLNEVTGQWEDLLPGLEGLPYRVHLHRLAAFVQDEWELHDGTTLNAGLRTERIETRSSPEAGGIRSRVDVVSPLLHLTQKLSQPGKDLLRVSLTRSFRAPNLDQLIPRPSINTNYPVNGSNTPGAADRSGNPALQPELATGVDLAYEHYLQGGGLITLGGFHRHIRELVRNRVTLESVSWSAVPRWVSRPANWAHADASGLELEFKGTARDFLPAALSPSANWNLRGSMAWYTSRVAEIPGPDARIEQQPAWALTLNTDYRWTSWPLNAGMTITASPGGLTQLNELQRVQTRGLASLDAYATWKLDKSQTLRLTLNNLMPRDTGNTQLFQGGDLTATRQQRRRAVQVQWEATL